MEEEYVIGVGSWMGRTTVHPIGAVMVLILGISLILLPRRFAILPFIILACFVSSAQRVVVFGADFDFLRILVLFGWVRLLIKGEFHGFVWNRLDMLVPAMHIAGTIIYTVQQGEMSALVYRLGWSFDGIGMYFFFRCILISWKDLELVGQSFILVSFPVAFAFLIERATGRNVFSMFGGVPPITVVRDGDLRCQGAFMHPILAGCFWAHVMPLMMYYLARGRILFSLCGLIAAMSIVLNTASSTPLMSVIFVLLGMSLFSARFQMRYIRWGLVATLMILHAIMNAPVWALLGKVNIFSSSTGFHRYYILDATINNFSKWWLWGEPNPMSWGIWHMRDITNQYILEALRGGLLTLVLFIVSISTAFGLVGRAVRVTEPNRSERLLVWCIGVCLFAQICAFFGVSYFGQIVMFWYLNLAMIGSLPTITSQTSRVPQEEGPSEESMAAVAMVPNRAFLADRFKSKSLR